MGTYADAALAHLHPTTCADSEEGAYNCLRGSLSKDTPSTVRECKAPGCRIATRFDGVRLPYKSILRFNVSLGPSSDPERLTMSYIRRYQINSAPLQVLSIGCAPQKKEGN